MENRLSGLNENVRHERLARKKLHRVIDKIFTRLEKLEQIVGDLDAESAIRSHREGLRKDPGRQFLDPARPHLEAFRRKKK